MKCPCPEQQDIPDGSKFCGHCGQPISARQGPTASFETAAEAPFSGGESAGGTDAGPTLIGGTMAEDVAAAAAAAAAADQAAADQAASEEGLQATMAMDALPLQPTIDDAAGAQTAEAEVAVAEPEPEPAAEPEPEPELPAQEPASDTVASPATVEVDASLTEQAEERPTPTELAKAIEEKPTEPEPAADTVKEPPVEAAKPAPAKKEARSKPKKKRTLQPPPDGAAAKKQEEAAPEGEKRGFRETMWFMDAIDPDALSAIETEDIRDRQEKFDDDGREIEKDVRRQFSLRAGEEEAAPGKTMMRMARQKFDTAQSEASSAGGGGATIAIVLGIVVALGAAAYFLFLK